MDPARLPENIPEAVLLDLFVQAVRQTLDRLREAMGRLAVHPGEPGAREVVRLCHNLKGSSRQMGFDDLGLMAAEMEAVACRFDLAGGADPSRWRQELEAAEERFRAYVDALESSSPTPDLAAITDRLRKAQP